MTPLRLRFFDGLQYDVQRSHIPVVKYAKNCKIAKLQIANSYPFLPKNYVY